MTEEAIRRHLEHLERLAGKPLSESTRRAYLEDRWKRWGDMDGDVIIGNPGEVPDDIGDDPPEYAAWKEEVRRREQVEPDREPEDRE